MKDDLPRRAAKRLALLLFHLNLRTDRALRRLERQRRFRLGGHCLRSAQCCEAPAIRANALAWHWPTLRRLFLRWQERVNGFVLLRSERAGRLFVFRCTHFDEATRSCDSYSSRPGMCRDYPRALLGQAWPQFLPGCGYRAVAVGGERLRKALEEQQLPPERLERLKKGLYLDD